MKPEPGGPVGPLAPPIFGRSANPISTGEGRLSPPITTGPSNIFHLLASLQWGVTKRDVLLLATIGYSSLNLANLSLLTEVTLMYLSGRILQLIKTSICSSNILAACLKVEVSDD